MLNGWLAYDELDFSEHIDGAFAIGYRLLDNFNEQWTRRFSRFKSGQRTSWNAAWAVLGEATPQLISALGLTGREVTFAPALSSSETTASPTGVLSVISQRCAIQCGSAFAPELLTKKPHISLHAQSRTVQERASILREARYMAGTVETPFVFVFDDLITAGSTLSAIAASIKAFSPGVEVFGLAVAKNERQMRLPESFQRMPNSHIHADLDRLWYRYDRG